MNQIGGSIWAAPAIMMTENPAPSIVVTPLSAADTPYIKPKGIAPSVMGTKAGKPPQNAGVAVEN